MNFQLFENVLVYNIVAMIKNYQLTSAHMEYKRFALCKCLATLFTLIRPFAGVNELF